MHVSRQMAGARDWAGVRGVFLFATVGGPVGVVGVGSYVEGVYCHSALVA